MFGKKIKFYRLKNKMTIADLAAKLGCTSAAISQYENDHRKPDMDVLNRLSDIFNVTPLDFLPSSLDLSFDHCGFRTSKRTSDTDKQAFLMEIEEKCSKQIEILDILDLLPKQPFEAEELDFDIDNNKAVEIIRSKLGVTQHGPIFSIVEALEKLGIVLLSFDAGDSIEGCNGYVNDIIYIFFNKKRTIERQRFTMIHEFVHLFFNHLTDVDEKDLEGKVDKLAGMILIPDKDVFDEFGQTNRHITRYLMESVAKEYIIAPSCLVRRLRDLSVVTDMYYRNFHKFLSTRVGSRKNEESLYEGKHAEPIQFEQMVYRALGVNLISVSKASELLQIPLYDVMNNNVGY